MGEVKCNGISVHILINSDGSDSVVWSWVLVTQTTGLSWAEAVFEFWTVNRQQVFHGLITMRRWVEAVFEFWAVNTAGLSWAEAIFEFWAVNRPICSSMPVCFFMILDHMGLLGELAMSTGKLDLAGECLQNAMDLSGLLVLYSSLGDAEGIKKLAYLAKEQGKNNVAFLCLFMLGNLEECLQLLVDSNRIPEAALMARSYSPSKVGNEEDGVDEAIEVDVDFADGAVLVSGNEDDEEWGTNNEGTPPA
ncbi:hypothetical protein GIB67_035881 [Kingdonia uniflora]|uniref:COPA/B TPR domain-containing protein n=1 Tax=Kingdonia uniflora TaxID=39325 RepID=A0A7J7P9D7_9MAGN|nr:hypothetical protein GIB67_035881 [Kingdonia uniflora]